MGALTKPGRILHRLWYEFFIRLRTRKKAYKSAKKVRNKIFPNRKLFFLLEHPKCGRTWLRYMTNQAEAQYYKVPLKNTLNNVWYPHYHLPRVFYVHGSKLGIFPGNGYDFGAIDLKKFAQNLSGCIFMIRKPERVMVSWYHHCRHREGMNLASLSDFIRNPSLGIESYVQFVEYYYHQLPRIRHLIIRYEDLVTSGHDSLKKVLDFIGLPLRPATTDKILSNSSFKKMQTLERSNRYNLPWLRGDAAHPNSFKVRKGGAEVLDEIFTAGDLEYMRNAYQHSHPFMEQGYCVQNFPESANRPA